MAQTDFTNLLIVVVVAFAAPFALGLAPRLRLPAVVLEIVVGIAIGPSGLGWVQIDEPVQSTSLPFIVTATMIGQQIGVVSKPTAAGLLSVIIFPLTGLSMLRRGVPAGTQPASTKPRPAAAILSAADRALCRTPRTTVGATA